MSASNGKKRIGVFLGGSSNERPISIKSGNAIYRALKESGFKTIKIDTRKSFSDRIRKNAIDIAFIALHGKQGEDGTIQRWLQKRSIAYTGSNADCSYAAFNKIKAKQFFDFKKIPTPQWVCVTRKNFMKKLKNFPFPIFSKPIEDGSSIGIFQVASLGEFKKKSDKIFGREHELLIEKQILGRELTVGILGKEALPVIELKPKRSFYDYRAKYTAGLTNYLVPAPITKQLDQASRRLALKTHRALGLRDFSRIDLMVDKKGKMHVLEANTIPGFTELSLLPKAASARGISFKKLCETIVRYAERRMVNA